MRVELREGLTESSVKRILRKFYIRQNLLHRLNVVQVQCRSLDQGWKQKQANPLLTLSKTFIKQVNICLMR